MNIRRPFNNPLEPFIQYVEFNREQNFFVIACDDGFRVYDTAFCRLQCLKSPYGALSAAAVLEKSNLFALTGCSGSDGLNQSDVVLWDNATNKRWAKVSFGDETPLRVCLTKQLYAVVFDSGVALFRLGSKWSEFNEKSRLAVYDSDYNPHGLTILGEKRLIYPGLSKGQVQIIHLSTMKAVAPINAHSSPLRALALSLDEELLATASDMGTLVRLWSLKDHSKIREFRRGIDPSDIFHLAFSPSCHFLALTSDKSTLHIFDLSGQADMPSSDSKSQTDQNVSITSRNEANMPNSNLARRYVPSVGTARESDHLSTSPTSTSSRAHGVGLRQGTSLPSAAARPTDTPSEQMHTSLSMQDPHQDQTSWPELIGKAAPYGRHQHAPASVGSSSDAVVPSEGSAYGSAAHKYGGLANLPGLPRILKDTYSTMSCPFDTGDEVSRNTGKDGKKKIWLSLAEGHPPKGQIGWINEYELAVVGAGKNAKYEKFEIGFDKDGRRAIKRVGWKKYIDDDGLN